MAEIKVSANVTSVDAQLKRITDGLNRLGQAAERVNRLKFTPFSQEDLKDIDRVNATLKQIVAQHPSIGTAIKASGQDPSDIRNIDLSRVLFSSQQLRTLVNRIGQTGPESAGGRFQRDTEQSVHDGVSKALSRFFSGVGGGGGQIGNAALGGASGGGGFGGMLRGGLVGAGLFAAFKAGQAVSEGYENAKAKAVDVDTLKRTMGDVSVSFRNLMTAADMAANGLGINSNESAKLAKEFNNLSGGLENGGDLVSEIRNSVGFGRSFGLSPEQSTSFFGNMRYLSGGEKNNRQLALMIGEVIAKTGMNARAGELLSAIQSQASATNRMSLAAYSPEGMLSAFSGLMHTGIRGLTSDTALSMLSSANGSMMNMGAAGEAGMNFTMAAFNRYGKLNPIQAAMLAEGGLFGTRAQMFGEGSALSKYLGSDTSGLMGSSPTTSNFSAVMQHMNRVGADKYIKLDMIKRFFGLNSYNQAAAFASMSPEEVGGLSELIGRNGINPKDVNETGILRLGKLSAAKNIGDLTAIRRNMDLSADEQKSLDVAQGQGFSQFRDALVKLAATKGQEETEGSKTRKSLKDIETATTSIGEKLLVPMNIMRDTLLVMAGRGGSASIRRQAAELEKSDITAELDAKAAQIQADFMSKANGDMSIDERKKLIDERQGKLKALDEEKARRFGEVDQRLKDEDAATSTYSKILNGGGSSAEPESATSAVAGSLYDRLIGQESGGKHYGRDGKLLTSSKGARGISQVMPRTGVDPGYGVKPLQNESKEEYIRFGRDYLGAMLKEFGGDQAKALAAYNAGPGAVKSAIAKYGSAFLSHMPAETQNYVSNIMGGYTAVPGGSALNVGMPEARVRIDGEFRQVDASGRPTSEPVTVQKYAPIPRSAGTYGR